MTRFKQLEIVLIAAKAVLEARENQMLTRVEWDALAAAVATAQIQQPATRPRVRIVFEDGLMMVMDDQNQGYDCLDLCDCHPKDAQAQIDRWVHEYAFDVETAKCELAAYFPEL